MLSGKVIGKTLNTYYFIDYLRAEIWLGRKR
jgi:hypothetical protein